MWPFSSSNDELDLLPADIREFYDKADPTRQVDEKKRKDDRVNALLAKNAHSFSHELEKHKREFRAKKAAAINCAELQEAVLECHKGWLMLSLENCAAPMKRASLCQDTQLHAFSKLRYDQCYSIKHCAQIRYIVDRLFTKNFGQLGENQTDESKQNFERDLDKAFDQAWK